ncbi:hypothetical protein QLQ12_02745 [Actinoplanes sp. NEAU-A12]|uniref:Uncharacterized protein n=1 Tax=Actinoplanes sandaracinus TaxID=3045177 RepID=A0ABT6WCX5_9ACTN|nr:hypothetical protein [Actinoplanes sandaracinus]MDI6097517.1 hypothetical protein [Actinoplanes sandaracinus]
MGLVMVGSSSASAEDPTPAPTVSAKATPGKKLCKVEDERLDEISGVVVTKDGFIVVNDGTDPEDKAREQIFFLDRDCKVTKTVPFSGAGPADPEDIVLAPDGKTLWVADIGNNGARQSPANPRPTVALWSMSVDGKKQVLYRLSYPEKDSHDAEALIFNGDGTPLIVTREIGKPAGIYQPTAALKADGTTPLKRVGEITLAATETPGNPVARLGNKTITGGAVTQDLTKVVLRTYTDALEWDVTGGDVLAALKKEPRTTGLPNETLGEAISYSTDGKLFYTISDMSGDEKTANNIREYTPNTTVAVKSTKSSGSGGGDSWYSDLSVDDVTYMVGGVGLLGLILVGAGVFGIMRFRRSPKGFTGDDDDLSGGGLNTDDPETELIGVGGLPQRSAAYAAGRPGNGPVYGAQSGPPSGGPSSGGPPPAAPPRANGGGPGGPQYGRPPGAPARGPQQSPARSPQQPARGPQPVRGPQSAPGRGGPQQAPARGPQQSPARGGQQSPARGPQQSPARGGQQQSPARGPQQQQGRGGQQQSPARGPQQQQGRGGQQQPPARGPQQQQGRGGQQQAPARGPQQPARGPQPVRGPQSAPGRGGPQQPPARGPQQQPPGRGGQQQAPRGPQGQKAPRSPGVYGGGGGRPPAPDDH